MTAPLQSIGMLAAGATAAASAANSSRGRESLAAGAASAAKSSRGRESFATEVAPITNPRRRARGFTLIELAVVVVIVGMLASVAVPLAQLAVQRSKESELRTALRQIRTALDTYKRTYDEGRIERKVGASGYPPSLESLVDGVPDIKDPNKASIYFLRRLPRDPFHPDRETPAADTWGTRSYASPPDAPASGADVFDVCSLSDRAGINGVPYREW
jgi:general secretion pathway protein G